MSLALKETKNLKRNFRASDYPTIPASVSYSAKL